MEIIWSDDAKQDYDENIDFLLREGVINQL